MRDLINPGRKAKGSPNARDSMRFDNQQFIFQEEQDKMVFPEKGLDDPDYLNSSALDESVDIKRQVHPLGSTRLYEIFPCLRLCCPKKPAEEELDQEMQLFLD